LSKTGLTAYLKAIDVALIGIFSALWAALNLTLGPLSFSLLGLPVLHDFGVFFTLLLVTWLTGKFGASLLVGVIGSIVAILMGGPLLIVGFAASAVVFDLLMSVNKHKIRLRMLDLSLAIAVTLVSAYLAGVLIGALFMGNGLQWALTVWGGWHLIGGMLSVAVTLPIIIALEKANVRRIKGEGDR